jgi:hypothetical protein
MKRIILLSFWLVALLTACQKDDNEPTPGERPEERLSKALADYKTQLMAAPYGWKARIYPEIGAGYSFLFKFGDNDRVIMSSDINANTAANPLESTYRLKLMQQPTLVFDTYSYLHILSDPDPEKSGGDVGQGKYGDFEFNFDSVSADSITLKGSLQGSKLVLVKATQDEATNYIKRTAENASAFGNITKITTYFKRLTIGNIAYDINVFPDIRFIRFSYYSGNIVNQFSTSYFFTENGLVLLEPFVNDNNRITNLNSITYDAASNKINLTVNNTPATIQEATKPIRIDLQAPRRFYNQPPNGRDYWVTLAGFTINDVPDALKVVSLPNFYFLIFWPKIDREMNTMYDRFGYVLLENQRVVLAPYSPKSTSRFTTDGRVVFSDFGNFGSPPSSYESIVNSTNQIWNEPGGFYVVQTGPARYDLVSAKDARAWISFE